MNRQLGILLVAMVLVVLVGAGCESDATPEPSTTVPGATTATETSATETTATTAQPTTTTAAPEVPEGSARYLLTFEATWSAATHPTDFPSNPHFSGLIGASHGSGVSLWGVGEIATPGIKNMAETGGKSPLDKEIVALITEEKACELISGGGIGVSPGVVTEEFTVNQDCPLVTVVSMIAPSPDWFVGVTGLPLYEDGSWVEELVVELYPYDAGTDSGSTYGSPNKPTGEDERIHEIQVEPLLVEGEVPPLGVFRFTRLTE